MKMVVLTGSTSNSPVKQLWHAWSQRPKKVWRETPSFQQGYRNQNYKCSMYNFTNSCTSYRCTFVKYNNIHLWNKWPCHEIPWSLPISESSDSLSPDVVMPTAPVTELEAGYKNRATFYILKRILKLYLCLFCVSWCSI